LPLLPLLVHFFAATVMFCINFEIISNPLATAPVVQPLHN
jgi:hypothetical protein